MSKKSVTLEPRKAPDPVALEAFVRGASPAATPPPEATSAPGHKVLQRRDGRAVVKSTVQLAPDLHQRLKIEAAKTGQDQSDIISEALEAHLGRQ